VTGYAALVLAGGRARRLGGVAKPALEVGGRALLDRVLGAVTDAAPVVVVGPRGGPGLGDLPAVVWTREDPPASGPVPALRAGLAAVPPGVPQVAVLAADLPFLDAAAVARLRAAVASGADVAVLVDDRGRDQYLAAVWAVPALRLALSTVEGDRVSGVYAAASRVQRLAVPGYPAGAEPWRDVDDPDGLDRARAYWEHSRQDEPTPRG
jgi:molybdenum cofactor guanylyltransferase